MCVCRFFPYFSLVLFCFTLFSLSLLIFTCGFFSRPHRILFAPFHSNSAGYWAIYSDLCVHVDSVEEFLTRFYVFFVFYFSFFPASAYKPETD